MIRHFGEIGVQWRIRGGKWVPAGRRHPRKSYII